MSQENLKKLAAEKAVEYVKSGMVVGLGHGSTTIFALRKIAEKIKSGELTDIIGIPCSLMVENDARELGIPLGDINDIHVIQVTIDGADEIDDSFHVIKGGGGALLREKIIAQSSLREIIIADGSKHSPKLGTKWAVPIEVLPYCWELIAEFLSTLDGDPVLRMKKDEQNNNVPFTTDQGNYILDTNFGPIQDVESLATTLKAQAGIIEHGLFVDLATDLIIAWDENNIEHRENNDQA